MAKMKPDKISTQGEVKRLVEQGTELRRLTTVPAMKALSPKRHNKLLRQLEKVDRAIVKITKIVE